MMKSKEQLPLLSATNQSNQTQESNGVITRRSYSDRDIEENFDNTNNVNNIGNLGNLENLENNFDNNHDRGCESVQHERERLFDEKNG